MRDVFRWDYRAHAAFVAPAGDKAELWRLGIGIVLIVSILIFLGQSMGQLFMSGMNEPEREAFIDEMVAGQTPFSVLYKLLQYALLIPAVALVVMGLHQRAPFSVLGPKYRVWFQFVPVMIMQIILIAALMILPPYELPGEAPTWNMGLGRWLMFLPLSLLVLGLQCAAEEIAFRGYLQQQLAARFQHPGFWMFLPAGIFGGLHYSPEIYGENAWLIALSATIFGLVMADITARAGSLGPAIAIHLANNAVAILVYGSVDTLSGLSLLRSPIDLADPDLLWTWLSYDLGWILVSWLGARLAIRR